MDKSLTDAVNAVASKTGFQSDRPLTITASWEDVLATGLDFNFGLLKDLCTLKEAGHRVIITAATDKDIIRDMVLLAMKYAEDKYGENEARQFQTLASCESISKLDLLRQTAHGQIHVDIALDSENISTQSILVRHGQDVIRQSLAYAQPSIELHVGQRFKISQVSPAPVQSAEPA